jgi:hypothetical protein
VSALSHHRSQGRRPPETEPGANIEALHLIIRRRTWLYRLPGQRYAQTVTFKASVTASNARDLLRRTVGEPLELWARSANDGNRRGPDSGHQTAAFNRMHPARNARSR